MDELITAVGRVTGKKFSSAGEALRALRSRAKMERNEFCEFMGTTWKQLGRWERGAALGSRALARMLGGIDILLRKKIIYLKKRKSRIENNLLPDKGKFSPKEVTPFSPVTYEDPKMILWKVGHVSQEQSFAARHRLREQAARQIIF